MREYGAWVDLIEAMRSLRDTPHGVEQELDGCSSQAGPDFHCAIVDASNLGGVRPEGCARATARLQ
jgi:hypothetical protein